MDEQLYKQCLQGYQIDQVRGEMVYCIDGYFAGFYIHGAIVNRGVLTDHEKGAAAVLLKLH